MMVHFCVLIMVEATRLYAFFKALGVDQTELFYSM